MSGTGASTFSGSERTSASDAFRAAGARRETQSPGGSDFRSSAAPFGQGSNTPVGTGNHGHGGRNPSSGDKPAGDTSVPATQNPTATAETAVV